MSHFAQSDEADKTFALLQMSRFNEVLQRHGRRGLDPCWFGTSATAAAFSICRRPISTWCAWASCRSALSLRRSAAAFPASSRSWRSRRASRRSSSCSPATPSATACAYTARHAAPHRRAAHRLRRRLPARAQPGLRAGPRPRAPLVGGVAMDALTVDITDIPGAQLWDEAVLMGRQGDEEITVHEVAKLKNSVSYDVLTGWRRGCPGSTSTTLPHETPLLRGAADYAHYIFPTPSGPFPNRAKPRPTSSSRASCPPRATWTVFICAARCGSICADSGLLRKPPHPAQRRRHRGEAACPRANSITPRSAASSTRPTPTSNSART